MESQRLRVSVAWRHIQSIALQIANHTGTQISLRIMHEVHTQLSVIAFIESFTNAVACHTESQHDY